MASVISLGTHWPAGLQHAVSEQLIPVNAPTSSYTWDVSVDECDESRPALPALGNATLSPSSPAPPISGPRGAADGDVEDELLVAGDSVVWSRGGMVRKTFRFGLEQETITQALLAYFPTSEDMPTEQPARDKGGFGDESRRRRLGAGGKGPSTTTLSKAVVVFLKTQAHIYFVSGTSHVVHMPFEVEAAIAAPVGVIIQRRARNERSAPVALKFPKVPPNSFVSSSPAAATGPSFFGTPPQNSQGFMPFSTAGLGNPKELPVGLRLTLGNMGDAAYEMESRWPRLVCLTDPLASLSGIVAEPEDGRSAGPCRGKLGGRSVSFLDPSEEMVHVEQIYPPDAPRIRGRQATALVVTANRRECTYTIWKLKYLEPADPFLARHQRTANVALTAAASRRRSSMAPGLGVGGAASATSTPVTATFRESLGTAVLASGEGSGGGGGGGGVGGSAGGVPGTILPGKRPRKSERLDQKRPPPLDIKATLEADKDKGVNRRSSRRISSMLARADLSASQQERGIFEQAWANASFGIGKRGDSLGGGGGGNTSAGGGGGGRASVGIGGFPAVIHASITSRMEAPIDSLLDELHATGDFEGFTRMGLDDVGADGMRSEMLLTPIQTIQADGNNVRYSLMDCPARSHVRAFIVPAPRFSINEHGHGQIVVGIQDYTEKRLTLVTLPSWTASTVAHKEQLGSPPDGAGRRAINSVGKRGDVTSTPASAGEIRVVGVAKGKRVRVEGVLDSAKITDGDISMVLVLSARESPPAVVSTPTLTAPAPPDLLSIQAPWTRYTALSQLWRGKVSGLGNSMKRGVVDFVLDSDERRQVKIQLRPTCQLTGGVLDACRSILPSLVSECMMAGWWRAMQWLQQEGSIGSGQYRQPSDGKEWSGLVVLLLAVYLNLEKRRDWRGPRSPQKGKRGIVMDAEKSGHEDCSRVRGSLEEEWREIERFETANSLAYAPWRLNRGWEWALDEMEKLNKKETEPKASLSFMSRHIRLARDFAASPAGDDALGHNGFLPTASGRPVDTRRKLATDMFVAMHLLLEEMALDIMAPDCGAGVPGKTDLRVLLARLARWMGWGTWAEEYELGGLQEELNVEDDGELTIHPPINPPFPKPSVLEWIHTSLVGQRVRPFRTLCDVYYAGLTIAPHVQRQDRRWDKITPRTLMFRRFLDKLGAAPMVPLSPVEFVEAMYEAGITKTVLESLPESVLIPLQDALFSCQALPPTHWPAELLELVNRSDVSAVLGSHPRTRARAAAVLTPTHNATWDFRSLCQTVEDNNRAGYNEGEGADKQAVVRALFRHDRRLGEAQDLLSTHKARVVRLDQDPDWTDAVYMERQKELVARMATGTLAIPAGRALLGYGLRHPLITQKLHISSLNLNCVVRPGNATISVEKSLTTEDKVCWSFFHQGAAAGLAISPDASGIDTSWILYNKPGHELSNRHAGFLLGLGLNGHLRHVAKWVAFKYLTLKHTMTSVGLLLGLAASHVGSMDSLMTRLLSIHATRLLPPGAADINISPQIQTSGIVGIGLVYARSRHRRMSDILMSEIEHVDDEDDEEPLRSECYRLAAGFALGFINLGRRSTAASGGVPLPHDDAGLTDRLVALATSTKRVEIVHVLDRAAAGAVVALALMYMKSEDKMVARKVDAPDAAVQFDYIRPDILLLRATAKHLIMWSEMRPTLVFIEASLPSLLRPRHRLTAVARLGSSDLPLFSIIAGTCFALALRHAGSASLEARDVLVHYLDQFMRITRLGGRDGSPKGTYDEELARNNARMCQDVLALSCAVVMAGTGDVVVLRRLRALHGRDDAGTTYGSHLAAHLAIGALFVGSGTMTFGNGDMAVAALLLAFYPVFPSGVMDNRSHLQALRHFWVLATEKRCLVARDAVTGQPISVPIIVNTVPENGIITTPTTTTTLRLTTPCLLPPLATITSLRTDASPSYWDTSLDMSLILRPPSSSPSSFPSPPILPTLHLRRRPFPRSIVLPPGRPRDPTEWVFSLPALRSLSASERAEVCDTASVSRGSSVDACLQLQDVLESGDRDALVGFKGLLAWADKRADRLRAVEGNGRGNRAREWWVRDAVLEAVRGRLWLESREWDD